MNLSIDLQFYLASLSTLVSQANDFTLKILKYILYQDLTSKHKFFSSDVYEFYFT